MKNIKWLLLVGVLFLGYGWYKKQQLEAIVKNYISFDQTGLPIQVLRGILVNGYGINLPINKLALNPNEVAIIVNYLSNKLGETHPITQHVILNGSIKPIELIEVLPV